jgi:hypothetical protein
MHSKNFETFKSYYESGLWSKKKLYNVVGKKTGITAEEYEEITVEPYEE